MKKLIESLCNWYRQLVCKHRFIAYYHDYQDRYVILKCTRCKKKIYKDF